MRIKSHIWVSAYLRRLDTALIPAAIVRRGDSDAGAIYIKVLMLDGRCQVFAPVSTGLVDGNSRNSDEILLEDGRAWRAIYKNAGDETEAETYLSRQASIDPDIWVIDVENREGRHMIGALMDA